MVKVRRTEAKKGEGSVGAASCFHLHCSLPWKTILTSLETFPKQVGDSCLELIPYPLSLCWKYTTYLLSGLKGWWLSPRFQGLWPISRATLKGSTVFLLQSVFLALVLNDLADGTALSGFPGSLGSLHPLALPRVIPAGAFQKLRFRQAATSLPAERPGSIPVPSPVPWQWRQPRRPLCSCDLFFMFSERNDVPLGVTGIAFLCSSRWSLIGKIITFRVYGESEKIHEWIKLLSALTQEISLFYLSWLLSQGTSLTTDFY